MEEKLNPIDKSIHLLRIRDEKYCVHNSLKTRIKEKKAEQPPTAPVCVQVPVPTPPPITPTVKFNYLVAFLPAGILFILSLLFPLLLLLFFPALAWIPVYYFVFFQKEKRENIITIGQSPAYQQQYNMMLQEQQRLQEIENQKYSVAKQEYDTKILPEFEAERNSFISELEQQISRAQKELDEAEKAVNEYWDSEEAKILPDYCKKISGDRVLKPIQRIMQIQNVSVEEALKIYEQRRDETNRKTTAAFAQWNCQEKCSRETPKMSER